MKIELTLSSKSLLRIHTHHLSHAYTTIVHFILKEGNQVMNLNTKRLLITFIFFNMSYNDIQGGR